MTHLDPGERALARAWVFAEIVLLDVKLELREIQARLARQE